MKTPLRVSRRMGHDISDGVDEEQRRNEV